MPCTMLLIPSERAFLQSLSNLAYGNPFLPERIEHERSALGDDFRAAEPVWSMRVSNPESPHANVLALVQRTEAVIAQLRERIAAGASVADDERELYETAVLFYLYHRYDDQMYAFVVQALDHGGGQATCAFYADFLDDWRRWLSHPTIERRTNLRPEHLFACFFQLRRAFHTIFRYIVGSSMPAARLRAAVWQSVFTHDLRRYRDALFERMGDIPTLITGPSGTGKELVARAIGLSRYVRFEPARRQFAGDFSSALHSLNLSALPATLVESELFGHRRGAFTGALQHRRGWLEVCEPWGAVFLDEVGDLEASIQVKLLRVLQTRVFQELGDTADRHFRGKVIAATNRNLAEAMQRGALREDFYYRLCADTIVTPSLGEQLRESPQVLRELILFIARGLVGAEAEALTDEVESWIERNLGPDYAWPGNVRELEQCVRSVLVRRAYHPAQVRSSADDLVEALTSGALSAEELICRYCALVYERTGSLAEAARRLGLDRRTVKDRIQVATRKRNVPDDKARRS